MLTCLVIWQTIDRRLENAPYRYLRLLYGIFKMPYATADNDSAHTFLRNTKIRRIHDPWFWDIIPCASQDFTGMRGLNASIYCQKAINVFNQEYLWPEMQNNLNIAEKEIAQLRMVESRPLEIIAAFVKPLIGCNAK